MKIASIVILSFISFCAFPQKGTIKISKSNCYNIYLTIGNDMRNDILSYSELKKHAGFIIHVKNCNLNATYKIVSYEISVNNKPKEYKKTPNYDFRNISETKENGKITVTNCIAECKVEGQPVKTIAILKKEFVILPDK